MGIFRMPRFIRRFLRRSTKEMSYPHALDTKKKLSIAYAIIAWHLFGYLIYKELTKDRGFEESGLPWHGWRLPNIEHARHYTISGFTVEEQERPSIVRARAAAVLAAANEEEELAAANEKEELAAVNEKEELAAVNEKED